MTPPLPAIMTPTLLASIRRHPNLPRHTWYFIAATALTVLNRPDEIPKVYRHAIDNTGPSEEEASPAAGAASGSPLTRDERLAISRRMREALVKTTAVGGLPKVRFVRGGTAADAAGPASSMKAGVGVSCGQLTDQSTTR